MKDTEQVTIFKSAKEAATAVLTGTGAAIHVAAAAMEVWSDPSFETVSSFVETARKKSGDVIDGVAGIDKLRGVARQMTGTFEVSGAPAQLPAVPPSLTESFGGAAAAAGSVSSMVPGLALGVGLLNLGVGVYNTVQIHRLGAQVGAMHADLTAGFDRVDSALAWQRHQIVVLAVGQASIASRLKQLRNEMNDGFNRVLAAVHGAEERRLADEYQQRVELVANRYRRLEEERVEGASPRPSDINRLIDAADALLAWLQPQLGRHEPGSPARLPLLVAKALATRANVEARTAEGGGRIAPDRDIARMFAEISREVFALCDGRSLHWIGVEAAAIITQYVYLARGLMLGQLFAGEGDATQLPPLGEWDDGLGALRQLASLPWDGDSAWLPLSTIDDLRWYLTWKQADERTTDLRDVRAVNVLSVSRSLGLSERPRSPSRAQMEALLAAALPEFRDQALVRLMLAFSWTRPPTVDRPTEDQPLFQSSAAVDGSTKTATSGRWAKAKIGSRSFDLTSSQSVLPVSDDGRRSLEILRVGARCLVGSPDGTSAVRRGDYWARWAVLGVGGSAAVRDGDETRSIEVDRWGAEDPTSKEVVEAMEKVLSSLRTQHPDSRTRAAERAYKAGLPAGVRQESLRWAFSWAANGLGSGADDSGIALVDTTWMLWTGGGGRTPAPVETWPFGVDNATPKVVVYWGDWTLKLRSVSLYRAYRTDHDREFFACLSAALGALGLISDEVGA